MRQRLLQVLSSDESDETLRSDAVVRRFWARAKPLPAVPRSQPAPVLDLAAARAKSAARTRDRDARS
jgi:hypothetical protein